MKYLDNKKIVIDNNDTYYLNITYDVDININENINAKLIIITKNISYRININLNINSNIIVNSLNYDSNIECNINLLENSRIIYNYSVISNLNSDNIFKVNHLNNNSYSEINNNGINLNNNKLFFRIDGIVPKELKNIECHQNSKIINYNDGNSKVIPNLIIDTKDINATHSCYIGNLDKELRFYMASRGLNDIDINNLLYKSILFGKMELNEEREEFINLIQEWR